MRFVGSNNRALVVNAEFDRSLCKESEKGKKRLAFLRIAPADARCKVNKRRKNHEHKYHILLNNAQSS